MWGYRELYLIIKWPVVEAEEMKSRTVWRKAGMAASGTVLLNDLACLQHNKTWLLLSKSVKCQALIEMDL